MKRLFNFLSSKIRRACTTVPQNLDEAIQYLIDKADPDDLRTFAAQNGESPGTSFHFSGGMQMRNNWTLWEKDGLLNTWFRANGIWHGDDKSAIIYKKLWCHLNDKPFDIIKESRYYKLFWAYTASLDFDGEPLILTKDERAKIKKDYQTEEARRNSDHPKRGRIILRQWDEVIDEDFPQCTTIKLPRDDCPLP